MTSTPETSDGLIPLKRVVRAVIVLGGLLWSTWTPAEQTPGYSYLISYQGFFTAGLEVDIGRVELRPGGEEREILMLASTRGFETAELLVPVRFCYRSRSDLDGLSTRQADWWSRIGDKVSRGSLLVDKSRQQVLRLHAERKLNSGFAPADDDLLPARASSNETDQDRDETPFPATGAPLDRLGMIQYLRRQPLKVGETLSLPATNGRDLAGYRIEVMAREELTWESGKRDTFKLHLQPLLTDEDADDYPTWLWLSADQQRLPLRFRSEHGHGRFEMRLSAKQLDTGVHCPVPEAVGLELPDV